MGSARDPNHHYIMLAASSFEVTAHALDRPKTRSSVKSAEVFGQQEGATYPPDSLPTLSPTFLASDLPPAGAATDHTSPAAWKKEKWALIVCCWS